MDTDRNRSADADLGGDASLANQSENRYQTSRGCLMLILIIIVLTVISLVAMWFMGDHTAISANG